MTRSIKPLMQFIPAVSPRFTEPTHLAPVVDVFERIARGEEVYATMAAPPRIFKSETIGHGVGWLLKQRPEMRICYASYAANVAERRSRRIRAIAERARVPLDRRSRADHDWGTGHEEGGLWATSIGGQLVSLGFDLVIVDDPHPNRVAVESPLARERVYEWHTDVAVTRGEPGCSFIVAHHRWHADDLIGRLLASGSYEKISLPAINEDGTALCPARLSLEQLAKKRELVGEYGFAGLYLQEPRPRGTGLFVDVHHYDDLPKSNTWRIVIGTDFAYTARSSADYSVAVVLATDGAIYYVLEVVRQQVPIAAFRASLEGLRDRYPGAPIVSVIGGQERAILELLAEDGLCVDGRPAIGDKFVRAQPVSAAWKARKVLLPREAVWLTAFVEEIVAFTGVKDRRDDQIDALAAAFAGLSTSTTINDHELTFPFSTACRVDHVRKSVNYMTCEQQDEDDDAGSSGFTRV